MVQCSSVQFSGHEVTTERGSSEGDIPTTDEHGQARNRGIDSPLASHLYIVFLAEVFHHVRGEDLGFGCDVVGA